jgi:hypothetical protein
MKRLLALVLLAGWLGSCGSTPQPTDAPPTQTPWIIIVTATPGLVGQMEPEPTQTPWIIIATPTPSSVGVRPPATATPSPTEAETRVTATPTATQPSGSDVTEFKYPSPTLVDPPNGRPVGWQGTVTLVWRGVGELAADEYYHVHLDRPPRSSGEQWYGDYVYTKETTHLVDQSFLAPFHLTQEQGRTNVYWWVRVVRKTGEDENGKPIGVDIGSPSEKRYFTVEPRPGDS